MPLRTDVNNSTSPDSVGFWPEIYEHPAPFKEDTSAIALFTEFSRDSDPPGEECRPITVNEVRDAINGTYNFW